MSFLRKQESRKEWIPAFAGMTILKNMLKKKKIALIAGARPNFMKAAPLCRELARQKINYFLINTGQHFSKDMAAGFFREFKIKPNYSLTPSRQSTIRQFADILTGIEEIFNKEK